MICDALFGCNNTFSIYSHHLFNLHPFSLAYLSPVGGQVPTLPNVTESCEQIAELFLQRIDSPWGGAPWRPCLPFVSQFRYQSLGFSKRSSNIYGSPMVIWCHIPKYSSPIPKGPRMYLCCLSHFGLIHDWSGAQTWSLWINSPGICTFTWHCSFLALGSGGVHDIRSAMFHGKQGFCMVLCAATGSWNLASGWMCQCCGLTSTWCCFRIPFCGFPKL